MPQEELDLLQFASRSMAEPCTGPSQIVWRQLRHADALGGFLHNVPNRLHRHAISPCPSNFVDSAEQFSSVNSSRGEPIVEFGSHPIRNRNRSNVASLADQINNGPMLFALLIQCQKPRLHASSTHTRVTTRASSVAFSFQPLTIGCLPERIYLALPLTSVRIPQPHLPVWIGSIESYP